MGRNRQGGIYRIRCLETGGVYVGSSKDLARRRWQHLHELVKGEHRNAPLQREWLRLGGAAFVFEVVALVAPAALRAEEEAELAAARSSGCLVFNLAAPRGNDRPRRLRPDIDWSAVDWTDESDRQIARCLGCSPTAVSNRRPIDAPSPGRSPAFLSRLHRRRLGSLTEDERRERGRRLAGARTAESEGRRAEAVRRAVGKSHLLASVDWSLPNYQIAKRLGVSKAWARDHRPAGSPSTGRVSRV